MKNRELFILKIDTDSYSGNFEREMIAYATGLHCIRGERETQDFHDTYSEEKSWEIAEYAIEVRDPKDDDRRPEYAHIDVTPGVYNNGMGFHYYEGEEEAALEAYKKACTEYAEKVEGMYAHMPEYGKQQAQTWVDRAAEATLENLGKYGAFQTVTLHFDKLPPKELLDLIKDRCKEYAALPDGRTGKKLQITGFRLIKQTITVEEELLSE